MRKQKDCISEMAYVINTTLESPTMPQNLIILLLLEYKPLAKHDELF